MVTTYPTPSHAIYCLADEHSLADAVRSLFDQERRTGDDVSSDLGDRTG